MHNYILGNETLTCHELLNLGKVPHQISLSVACRNDVLKGRTWLESYITKHENPIYGINTGFGALCDIRISESDLEELQQNLVMSHACGMGEFVPEEIVRWMLFTKIRSLSLGYSGITEATLDLLIAFYNHHIHPVIYTQGSLGASGDLAPLAHLSLPLLGKGDVWYKGEKRASNEVLQELQLKPVKLSSKEGLALLNGTQFMLGYGIEILHQTERLFSWAEAIAAISLDAFDARPEPFHHLIQDVRIHPGQKIVAQNILAWLSDSKLLYGEKLHVQDPYSFRCTPQVLGASRDVLTHVHDVFSRELNAVTDNPTVFPESNCILSGGNFHGQPLAMAFDYLGIALAEVGSISERRTYQLVSGKRGLNPFLAANPGLHSGLMIPQYTAASIVSKNKQLCTPASADNVESSAGQEDHVSMGANAATKTYSILENLERILAIELFTASQALDLRGIEKSSSRIKKLLSDYRCEVPFVSKDRELHIDLSKSVSFIRHYSLP